MKKLVAIMLVCLLWFGFVGAVHSDQIVEEEKTAYFLSSSTGAHNSDGDPFWDDDGGLIVT